MKDSFIRRGNHFIRLPNTWQKGQSWVLIDGPWYSQLMAFSQNGERREIMLPVPEMSCLAIFDPTDCPTTCEYSTIIWEAIRWHPGTTVHPDRARRILAEKGYSWWRIERIASKWHDILDKRKCVGWRLLPDGKLPAYFGKPDYEEVMVGEMESWEKYFDCVL